VVSINVSEEQTASVLRVKETSFNMEAILYIPPKRWHPLTTLQGVTSQKTNTYNSVLSVFYYSAEAINFEQFS
jgi:hypothetical protein